MEVSVDAFGEHLAGERQLVNGAYLVFVAIDDLGQPHVVEPFHPESAEQQLEWQQACLRQERRLLQRQARRQAQTDPADSSDEKED